MNDLKWLENDWKKFSKIRNAEFLESQNLKKNLKMSKNDFKEKILFKKVFKKMSQTGGAAQR